MSVYDNRICLANHQKNKVLVTLSPQIHVHRRQKKSSIISTFHSGGQKSTNFNT